ncbi:FadR/GntR family transcriptional regulator [Leucobacter sp. BZR 635]
MRFDAEEGSERGRSAPLLGLVQGQTLTDEIADRLVTALALGDYLPGARLPTERDLAAMLGVGRVTVRSAIERLVGLGLVRKQQGRGGGSFVVEPATLEARASIERVLSATWDKLIDQHEAQSWMHGAIAAAAAERRTDDDLAELKERLESYRSAESGGAAQKADEALHLAIARATHSPALQGLLVTLESQIHLSAPAHPWGSERGRRDMEQRALIDHEEIVAAIEAGDVVRAHEVGRVHARINMEHLENALRDASQDGPDSGPSSLS